MQLTQKNLIAGQAWEVVKAAGDPSWSNCHPTHKEKLIAQLEAVVSSGGASNPFEKEVKKILEGLDSDAAQERALLQEAAATESAAVKEEPASTGVEASAPQPKRSSKKPAAKPAKAAKKKK